MNMNPAITGLGCGMAILFFMIAVAISAGFLHLATLIMKIESRSYGKAITAVLLAGVISFGFAFIFQNTAGAGLLGFMAGVIAVKYAYGIDWLRAFLTWLINYVVIIGIGFLIALTFFGGAMMLR